MARIVITGSTGFLGKSLLKKLSETGNYIYALKRKETREDKNFVEDDNIKFIDYELANIEEAANKIKEADIFIHLAWDSRGEASRYDNDIQSNNVIYGKKALNSAKIIHCSTFVFAGSQAEYGNYTDAVSEEYICNPIIPYGVAKNIFGKEAQTFCENNGMRLIHLRIFSVYGYGDRETALISLCINSFNNGKHLKLGLCNQLWNYLYIDDFAESVYRLIKSECDSGIYNIAGPDTRELKDYVTEVYNLSNRTGSYSFDDYNQSNDRKVTLNPDISKLQNAIKWNGYISFQEGIKRTMNYYKITQIGRENYENNFNCISML